ncbi:hypothetical protein PTSG_10906 [Salpingoeca rosetta]|uniref:Uncharacterized protein n=1 Tax=Salpingoeca rosetta (strain ATCC 50818 / BSB-021) TaxID=946362 RepID=F2URC4_SALR5|nr:uncharacterized protein PTSG_10906 [Salpingoeca rosetta]EGD80227.1 hypothetical protein PTSG_10906 [Salpingoeca rosetta]|eukprot:XP_004988289.1 hypothetical protein PTSG_10906 [Salpingoeca rosetta]
MRYFESKARTVTFDSSKPNKEEEEDDELDLSDERRPRLEPAHGNKHSDADIKTQIQTAPTAPPTTTMSFEAKEVYLPNPRCERGKPFVLSADPKGKYFVYPHGKTIVVRDVEDPSKGYTYSEHAAQTTVAKFAPSGFYVASADVTGKVRIWDTTQEEHALKYEYRPLAGRILDLAWTEDSKRIVVCGESGERYAHAFLWDSGSSVGELIGHTKVANSIDVKPNRPYRVATASDDAHVGFYAGPPFKLDHKSNNHSNFVNSVRFSPDGAFFVSAGADGKVFVYDGKTGELLSELKDGEKAHARGVYAVSWSADSKRFITASADMTVKMWNAESKELVTAFPFEDALDNQQLGCLWMGEHIISVGLNGHIYFLDEANPATPKRVITGHNRAITALTAVPGSGEAYSASYDGKVCRYDLSSGLATELKQSFDNSVLAMAAADGVFVAASIADTAAVTPLGADALGNHFEVESTPNDVAHAAGVTLIACLNEVVVRGNVTARLPVDYEPQACALSPDAKEAAVGGKDGKIRIYDVADAGLAEKKVLDASGPVTALAYSPDAAHLASGDANRNVYVFDRSDFSLKMNRWRFHTAKINALAWSPNSRLLASSSLDTNVIVWNMDKATKRIAIKGAHPQHDVTAVAWLDDTTVMSGGQDGALRTFAITPHQ